VSYELVGYFPKTTAVPAGWSYAGHVTELCSVSTCIASAPDAWLDFWLHNELGFFNTATDARAVIPPTATEFSLFAYRLFSTCFDKGVAQVTVIPALLIEPLPPVFDTLGFDIVTKGRSDFSFECSPLSCNGLASEAPVNRYCLVADSASAIRLAAEYSRDERGEPGLYHVIEVLRADGQGPGTAA